MTDYEELAKRCEAATGADRELEALIWCALNGKRYKGHNQAYGGQETQVEYTEPPKRTRNVTSGYKGNPHPPRWTALVDAALTLVPVGWTYQLTSWLGPEYSARICQYNPGDYADGEGMGANPALAITAAALRAISKGETP